MKYKAYVAIDALDDYASIFLFSSDGRYAVTTMDDVLSLKYDSPDMIKCWCHEVVSDGWLVKFNDLRFNDMIDPQLVYEFEPENDDD